MNRDLKENTDTLVSDLLRILADTHVLYIMTLNCHWNVEGGRFFPLHKLFEEQYKILRDNEDLIAEKIRMIGAYVPASLSHFLKYTSLNEVEQKLSEDEMLNTLSQAHEKLIAAYHQAIEDAEQAKDPGLVDLLTQVLNDHEKMAWMLRSHI